MVHSFGCFFPYNGSHTQISSYSMLPALSLNGILHLDVQAQSYTATIFNGFIDGLLDSMNPFPQKNSVMPAFITFSAIKARIQENCSFAHVEMDGRVNCDPYAMLWEAVFETVDQEKALGWYRDSGYI
ncbi:hypothetical protein GYMLUDRAFT_183372 [Collybiopsis luxurians FD-317 M1]|uniref:Uncharacterized protein n=1 Tax=Collybiopsis luxurians FD-317 M1 TaxID=944289 RepID=A0A0D0C5A6_9AGAR|nr:hypothetical protein GYMLUDRAFT_183372 [Collybiopsis luxurians FD-317 M1]